ncbi:HPr kinase/phosphorylase [Nitratireductor pacificus]|uniref:HPr kinase n=1 Tax=Nitratireductor pacificus pht-3B TaxID=391937 RepID=K2N403_9HYPH|nr:HPr kinase [Nitratireductor pacificus]EKF18993.1 HPr kinase [Nitratireductor pacificus pht-3B]
MRNRHATALVLADSGIVIEGASGAGKTMLALELIAAFSAAGLFARLVSDDQVFLAAHNGRLVARAPGTIGGLAEARGFGPASIEHVPAAVIDLVIRLVDPGHAPRVHDQRTIACEGVVLPCLDLPARSARGAVQAVAACLGLPPFDGKHVTR